MKGRDGMNRHERNRENVELGTGISANKHEAGAGAYTLITRRDHAREWFKATISKLVERQYSRHVLIVGDL